MNDQLPTATLAKISAAMTEAHGLLTLMKPLLTRKGKLTLAEQDVLLSALTESDKVLSEAIRLRWDWYSKQRAAETESEAAKTTALRMAK